MTEPQNLAAVRQQLQHHPLYRSLSGPADLRVFMQGHVFAVWDFMTLLKSLQRELTAVSLPWVPTDDPETARLVNELVLAEETDAIEGPAGVRHLSHFAWYLEAMSEVGADRRAIDAWVSRIRSGASFEDALAGAQLPAGVRAFLGSTAAILREPLAVRAAAFHHSRELVIPEMFLPIAENLDRQGVGCPTLIAYLRRHVMLDSGEHSLASEQMVRRLLEASPAQAERAQEVSLEALVARTALWTALLGEMKADVQVIRGSRAKFSTEHPV